MTRLEVPKRAIGLGFNIAALPFKAPQWAAGIAVHQATEAYQRFTIGGHEHADELLLQLPAHNAAVGADALNKVPIVDKLLVAQTKEVATLEDMGAEPLIVKEAIQKRRKLVTDRKILKATAYGLIGNALRQVIHNDLPAQVEAAAYPAEVEAVVLTTAIETDVVPGRLDLPEMDQEIIAIRLAKHKDFM